MELDVRIAAIRLAVVQLVIVVGPEEEGRDQRTVCARRIGDGHVLRDGSGGLGGVRHMRGRGVGGGYGAQGGQGREAEREGRDEGEGEPPAGMACRV